VRQQKLEFGGYFCDRIPILGISGLAFLDALFDVHVTEFAGFEDVSALDALDEFGIFIATDDLHARVFAGLPGGRVWLRRRLQSHESGSVALIRKRKARIAEFHGILDPYGELSSVSELRGCELCGRSAGGVWVGSSFIVDW